MLGILIPEAIIVCGLAISTLKPLLRFYENITEDNEIDILVSGLKFTLTIALTIVVPAYIISVMGGQSARIYGNTWIIAFAAGIIIGVLADIVHDKYNKNKIQL